MQGLVLFWVLPVVLGLLAANAQGLDTELTLTTVGAFLLFWVAIMWRKVKLKPQLAVGLALTLGGLLAHLGWITF